LKGGILEDPSQRYIPVAIDAGGNGCIDDTEMQLNARCNGASRSRGDFLVTFAIRSGWRFPAAPADDRQAATGYNPARFTRWNHRQCPLQ